MLNPWQGAPPKTTSTSAFPMRDPERINASSLFGVGSDESNGGDADGT
jgi:hypothetical protein